MAEKHKDRTRRVARAAAGRHLGVFLVEDFPTLMGLMTGSLVRPEELDGVEKRMREADNTLADLQKTFGQISKE